MKDKKVAIVYHESFSRRSYLTHGTRLQDFPGVLAPILEDKRFYLVHANPIEEKWILMVHGYAHVAEVMRDPLCSTAWHSVGSVVEAAERIFRDGFTRAFATIGTGGHHAGKDYFWGYCCFNDLVIAVQVLRNIYGIKRFAIVDTDAHHGDGTRELLNDDENIFHLCICQQNYISEDKTKIDVSAYDRLKSVKGTLERNTAYAAIVDEYLTAIEHFSPQLVFWYFGFDTHKGDYGDLGLTLGAYQQICKKLCQLSDKVCEGRLVVILGGGSSRTIANQVIPPIIRMLGE